MSRVYLKIEAQDKRVNLDMDNPNDYQKSDIVRGIFGLFSVSTPPTPPPSRVTPPVTQSEPVLQPQRVTPVIEPTAKPVTLKNIHNPVIFTDEQAATMEAALAEPEEDTPDFFKSGIKVKEVDGVRVKHYRCRYKCIKCENKGNHYIPEGVETVDCHECQTSLKVKKATPGTIGIGQDKFGNWYVAGAQEPVIAFVSPHTNLDKLGRQIKRDGVV